MCLFALFQSASLGGGRSSPSLSYYSSQAKIEEAPFLYIPIESIHRKAASEAKQRNMRQKPNILVTGTPGTGKTTMCTSIADDPSLNIRHINLGDLVKQKNLHDGWDEEYECFIMNEDLVIDELEDLMEEGGNILDYHSCDFFPQRWFDCVIVLQTDNSILYDRLTSRGYMGQKLQNNIECEIFQVLLEEAHNSYSEEIIMALRSDTIEDVSRNVDMLKEWVRNWRPRNQ